MHLKGGGEGEQKQGEKGKKEGWAEGKARQGKGKGGRGKNKRKMHFKKVSPLFSTMQIITYSQFP